MESRICLCRHQSSSLSSLHWGRWLTCPCPAYRPEACFGFPTWQRRILSTFCPWLSLEPCSSSWRSVTQTVERFGFFYSLWPLVGRVLLMSPSLQLGAESGIDNPNLRAMKTVFRVMPFIILPLTINFPTVCLLFSLMTFFLFCCFVEHVLTTRRNVLPWSILNEQLSTSKIPFLLKHVSGRLHLLVHLQLLFIGSSGSSQAPTDQRQVEDSRENQTPLHSSASKWRLHRKHEEGWAFSCVFSTDGLAFVRLLVRLIYICWSRLEKCSAGPAAGRKGKEDQKSSRSGCQRSVTTS